MAAFLFNLFFANTWKRRAKSTVREKALSMEGFAADAQIEIRCVAEPMSMDARNPAIGLAFPVAGAAEAKLTRSELESEVIGLFDRFRNRLLRYVLSFGLPID